MPPGQGTRLTRTAQSRSTTGAMALDLVLGPEALAGAGQEGRKRDHQRTQAVSACSQGEPTEPGVQWCLSATSWER